MFALFLVAILALTAVAALGVLADSGLRWWSAFGQLRREMTRTAIMGPLPELRPVTSLGECSGFGRGGARQSVKISINRAA